MTVVNMGNCCCKPVNPGCCEVCGNATLPECLQVTLHLTSFGRRQCCNGFDFSFADGSVWTAWRFPYGQTGLPCAEREGGCNNCQAPTWYAYCPYTGPDDYAVHLGAAANRYGCVAPHIDANGVCNGDIVLDPAGCPYHCCNDYKPQCFRPPPGPATYCCIDPYAQPCWACGCGVPRVDGQPQDSPWPICSAAEIGPLADANGNQCFGYLVASQAGVTLRQLSCLAAGTYCCDTFCDTSVTTPGGIFPDITWLMSFSSAQFSTSGGGAYVCQPTDPGGTHFCNVGGTHLCPSTGTFGTSSMTSPGPVCNGGEFVSQLWTFNDPQSGVAGTILIERCPMRMGMAPTVVLEAPVTGEPTGEPNMPKNMSLAPAAEVETPTAPPVRKECVPCGNSATRQAALQNR